MNQETQEAQGKGWVYLQMLSLGLVHVPPMGKWREYRVRVKVSSVGGVEHGLVPDTKVLQIIPPILSAWRFEAKSTIVL